MVLSKLTFILNLLMPMHTFMPNHVIRDTVFPICRMDRCSEFDVSVQTAKLVIGVWMTCPIILLLGATAKARLTRLLHALSRSPERGYLKTNLKPELQEYLLLLSTILGTPTLGNYLKKTTLNYIGVPECKRPCQRYRW